MTTNTTAPIDQLRASLLATLADLRDRDNPMPPDQANAIARIANTLIDSAKVEIEFKRLTGDDQSQFFGTDRPAGRITHHLPSAHNPFGRTVHRISDASADDDT